MTNEPSPRPWHTANFINGIEDANNGKVAANIRDADAALIVAAVNERDRLRDIVRDALPFVEGAIDSVSTILGNAEMSKAASECGAPPKDMQEAFVADGRRVLREARAALGEGEK